MEVWIHVTHVNGWFPAVYILSCMSQNFRLIHGSNLSVRKVSKFSAHVSGVSATPILLYFTNMPHIYSSENATATTTVFLSFSVLVSWPRSPSIRYRCAVVRTGDADIGFPCDTPRLFDASAGWVLYGCVAHIGMTGRPHGCVLR